jgi:hypothetical protein
VRKCLTSLIVRELQIKTTICCAFIPGRKAIVKTTRVRKCWRRHGEKISLADCQWEWKLVQSLWKTEWQLLKKLKIELPQDLAIPILGTYS